VLISVRDRGIGIKPEVRRRLFEGFYRAADARVRQRRGAGLGLALVKHIVDAHGGSIDVESRLVKGSTFRIFLPENPPKDEQSQPD
jgi:signal transduction histidine kinase